ncbi:MAG: autotransporter outer membrane beta-barrel domain-containing protein, partial [Aestuariivirga sp.]
TGAAVESTKLAALVSASQSIWYDTLGVLGDRFDELHKEMRSVAAVSMDDGTTALVQPVAYNASSQNGLWAKLIGRTAERDADTSIGGGSINVDYGLDETGILIGVDGVVTDAGSPSGALALGLTGGYVAANQDFESGSSADYEGFTVGVYASYVKDNFHLDGQLKADILSLGYSMASTPGGNTQADVTNLGGSLEGGYCLDVTDHFYMEPVAQLAYVNTNIRNGDILGTAFTADGESLRGAIGMNFGGLINAASSSDIIFKPQLSLKLWNEFEGDNSASFSTFTVTDNTPSVFGEVGFGMEAISIANGWSGNVKGDVQFAKDFTSFGGFLGLQKSL